MKSIFNVNNFNNRIDLNITKGTYDNSIVFIYYIYYIA